MFEGEARREPRGRGGYAAPRPRAPDPVAQVGALVNPVDEIEAHAPQVTSRRGVEHAEAVSLVSFPSLLARHDEGGRLIKGVARVTPRQPRRDLRDRLAHGLVHRADVFGAVGADQHASVSQLPHPGRQSYTRAWKCPDSVDTHSPSSLCHTSPVILAHLPSS